MRRFLILLTILSSLFSCKVNEKPVFVNIENIAIHSASSKTLLLDADARFMNPNGIGGALKTDEIKILINDKAIGYVSTKPFKVPANDEFIVPLTTEVPLDSIWSTKHIGGLIGSLFNRKIKIQYKGDIIYKALGFSYTYAIDETQNIDIKL